MTEERSPQTTPFFVRVPGPGKREVEEQLAVIVEEAVDLYDGRDLGRRRRRDAHDGDVRVDFTYDATDRPTAIEIWRPVEQHVAALGSELLKLEGQLREIAQADELGTWMIAVRVDTERRAIKGPLLELMRDQRSRAGDTLFSAKRIAERPQ